MGEISVRERIKNRRKHGVEPESFLMDVGAIHLLEDEDQLAFTEPFADYVKESLEELRESGITEADIVRLYDVDHDHVEDPERSYPAWKVINTVYKWPSEAALMFDLAVDLALRDLTDRWEEVPARQRPRIIQALRSFQDECYFCGGHIVYGEEPVESCCSERQVLTLHCEGCDRRFLEFTTEQGLDGSGQQSPPTTTDLLG